ncbi:MAG: mechanosensitive ion channel [Proteobacteria bacterium]|nr:mechanosensitive ion channel [Pseudomonadota bacterium]MBU1738496.1 mechanosensitive ion channel [Pseudomonadota bacterium]
MDFNQLLDNIKSFQENPLLKPLIIVIVYAVLAKIADLVIDRIFRKIAGRTSFSSDDKLIDLLHAPACFTIFLVGILHALSVARLNAPWQTVLPAATKSLLLFVFLLALARFFNWLTELNITRDLKTDKLGKDFSLLLKNLIRVVVLVAGLLWLLAIWQIDLTPLFASAGIAGIAIALAAKDTLANFFGGLSIFMDKTFKLGEYIILESGERGEVVEIGIRSTRIKTRDDVLITIPNSILANSKIINESAPIPRFRIRVPVGVAYGSDLDQVQEVLLQVAANNPNVALEPEARVRLRAFADSSVNFELLCWVDDPRLKGLETHNLLTAIYKAFGANNISIPFPQRDVHLISS